MNTTFDEHTDTRYHVLPTIELQGTEWLTELTQKMAQSLFQIEACLLEQGSSLMDKTAYLAVTIESLNERIGKLEAEIAVLKFMREVDKKPLQMNGLGGHTHNGMPCYQNPCVYS